MSVDAQNITKTFGAFKALDDLSLTIEPGELVALLGPSGSGKTTLLRIIAGLEVADAGSGPVRLQNENMTDRAVGSRRVGFVFQHYALFRHMTIFENIAFGLRVRRWRDRPPRAEIENRVIELLRLVQLDGLAARFPSQLSGGQRQRVALARALAVEPKILLLDEPFGALDAKVRRELRRWLRRLHEEIGITTVFVTHDQEEALELADRVAVLNAGKIEQIGTPEEVYERPATPFIYNFLGNVNLLHGRVHDGRIKIGETAFAASDANGPDRPQAVAYVRPHDVEIELHADVDTIPSRVEHVSFAGPNVHVKLTRADTGETMEAALTRERYRELGLKVGAGVFAKLRNPRVFSNDYSI